MTEPKHTLPEALDAAESGDEWAAALLGACTPGDDDD